MATIQERGSSSSTEVTSRFSPVCTAEGQEVTFRLHQRKFQLYVRKIGSSYEGGSVQGRSAKRD